MQDLRHALVMMRRNPGFAAAALLTLALGIGVTTAVFSVVDAVLWRPLPYPDAHRIVELSEEHPGAVSPMRDPVLSDITFHAWSHAPRTIESLAAYFGGGEVTVQLPEGAVRMPSVSVTPSLFTLLGATPALGRFFLPSESAPGADAVVVLSHRAWRERFGATPSAVGRSVLLDGRPYTIVGVAPSGFTFPDPDTLLWRPKQVTAPAGDAVAGGQGSISVMRALARLAPQVTTAQAQAEGTAAARSMPRPMTASLLFGEGGQVVVHVRGLADAMTRRIRPALLVLAATVLAVLLMACGNVVNLLLSQGVTRQRELAVRAALGAGRTRLMRQLLTESLLLAGFGGAIGAGLASVLIRLLPAMVWHDFPRLESIRLYGQSSRLLAYAVVASFVAASIAGLLPAFRGTQFELSPSLRGGNGAASGGFHGRQARLLRQGLLGLEAALAVLLLVAGTLLARSFARLIRVDAGYTPSHVLVAQIFVPRADVPDVSQRIQRLATDVLDRLRVTRGVVAAGAGNMMPLDNSTSVVGFRLPFRSQGGKPMLVRALEYVVTPGYAEALGLRLREGRLLTEADRASGGQALMVNEEFARLYLPAHPVGLQWVSSSGNPPAQGLGRRNGEVINEIVGMVGNVLKSGNDSRPQAEMYQVAKGSYRFGGRFEIAVRITGDPASVAPLVRDTVRQLSPEAAVETTTLAGRVASSMEQPRFAATVVAAFALLALALASVGLSGALAFWVSQRRRELGVRAALGAERWALVWLVVRDGLTVTAAGLTLGLGAAVALSRLLQQLLFGVAALDPFSFLAAPVLLVSVALAACLVPARRAAAVDPATALRCE